MKKGKGRRKGEDEPQPIIDATVPAATVAGVTVAAGAASATEAQPEPVGAVVKDEKPKARYLWMWLSVGLVLILGCLVTFLAIRSIRTRTPLAAAQGRIQTQMPFQTPGAVLDLAKAEENASKNPNDPKAYLQLALADLNANLPNSAQDAIVSLEKTGKADENFYWDAGRQLAKKKAWLLAARLDVDADVIHPKNNPLTGDLRTQLSEAVYQASSQDGADKFIPIDHLEALDQPLFTIAQARYTFYHGDKAKAQASLDQLLQNKPGFPEGQLLQAEFSAKVGDSQRARQVLADLRKNSNAAPWMLSEANSIEGTLP